MSKRASDSRDRGSPYIKQADNGFWYIHWSEQRRSKRQSTGTKDETQAYQTFAQWILIGGKDRIVGAAENGDPLYSIADLWGVYVKRHVEKNVVGKQTLEYAWKNLEPHFGLLPVSGFNQDTVDSYEKARAAGKIGKKAKSVTIRREIVTLLAALNFCANPPMRLIPKASIETIILPTASEPRERWLRVEEIQRLLTAAASMRRPTAEQIKKGEPARLTRTERFLWVALETAARKQAILDLEWDRVDFEAGVIHFNVPGRVKTKKKRADVPISAALRPVLERAYKERINNLVLDNKAAIWKSIQVAAIKAGFSNQPIVRGEKPKSTGISPHVLRHSAATIMARNGVPLWKIAKTLGNSLAMVEKVYAKWSSDDAAGTVDKISGGLLEMKE